MFRSVQDSVILVKDGAISYSNKYANMLLKQLQGEGSGVSAD